MDDLAKPQVARSIRALSDRTLSLEFPTMLKKIVRDCPCRVRLAHLSVDPMFSLTLHFFRCNDWACAQCSLGRFDSPELLVAVLTVLPFGPERIRQGALLAEGGQAQAPSRGVVTEPPPSHNVEFPVMCSCFRKSLAIRNLSGSQLHITGRSPRAYSSGRPYSLRVRNHELRHPAALCQRLPVRVPRAFLRRPLAEAPTTTTH